MQIPGVLLMFFTLGILFDISGTSGLPKDLLECLHMWIDWQELCIANSNSWCQVSGECYSCPVCPSSCFVSVLPSPFFLSSFSFSFSFSFPFFSSLFLSFLLSCLLSPFTLFLCSFPSIKLEILILANMVIMERFRSPIRPPSSENEPRPLVNFPVWTRPMDNQVCLNRLWTYHNQVLLLCLRGNLKGLLWLLLDLQYKDVAWLGWCIISLLPLHHGDIKVTYGQDLPIMVKIHLHRQEPLHNRHRALLFPEHLLQGARLFQGEPKHPVWAKLESRWGILWQPESQWTASSSSYPKFQLEPIQSHWRLWSSYRPI